MNNAQIIHSAIEIVLKERRLLSPGDTAAHASDPKTYAFYRYENGNAVIGFNGVIKSFPMWEVFDPNIVKKVALEVQANLLLPSKN
jgi:hypothetical protein